MASRSCSLLIGVIMIVGALTFFCADALGPIVEQLLMMPGNSSRFGVSL